MKRNWSREKHTFADHIKHDPHAYRRIQSKFDEIEKNPSRYRYSAVTRYTRGDDRCLLPLANGGHLFGNHAYSLKGIARDSMGQRIFKIINPHDTSKVLSLSEQEFLKNFSLFNGVQYHAS